MFQLPRTVATPRTAHNPRRARITFILGPVRLAVAFLDGALVGVALAIGGAR